MHYNFCRIRKSLRVTPAEAGLTDHVWSLEELVGLLENERYGSCGMISQIRMFALGIAWVGGWGFLFFTNPQLSCKLFRIKNPTPKRLRAIKITGAIELALVFTSCVLTAVFGMPSR
jgi:hypothetical protein